VIFLITFLLACEPAAPLPDFPKGPIASKSPSSTAERITR